MSNTCHHKKLNRDICKANYITSSKKISKNFVRFIIIFREAELIDKQLDPFMRKMEVARLIASKIAYQWFNNVLFCWSHFWLHDGLATLFAEKVIVKVSTITNIAISISIIYLKVLYIIFIL